MSLAALVALSVVSAAGAANTPRPQGLPGKFDPAVLPLGLSNQPATVVVELAGDPVTVAEADSGTTWTADQKNSLENQLKSKQAPVENAIRSRGGQVLASYQNAYNGVKAQVTPSEAESLATLPNVVAVHPLQTMTIDNVHGVPLVGGPDVWGGSPSFAGEGMKVAVIDTGVDYTHADFGGSGNPADYTAALASDTLPANAAWFGPAAPKVKGGTDLVGDDYNADPNDPAFQPIPHPDPNPLDCNGHGTHTSGTATGFGVLSNGHTFTGPYNATTVSGNSWNVGPGMAPKADLYSVRVFGCNGSTNVTIDAIEWAVDHDMDVINMSLGSPFGSPDDPAAVASTNAAKSGVIVIASSGNAGSNPYMTGSPATGRGAVSVAANDPTQSFPAAILNFAGGPVTAINANGFTPLPAGPLNIRVIRTATGAISLGCSVAADTAAGPIPPNTVIVVARGTCARVAKAIFGQQAGAAAVIMVNNSGALPPFEGKITSNPDDGTKFTVTIPFLGVAGGSNPTTSANGQKFIAADGTPLTMTATTLANPAFKAFASFTSFGPATSDSSLKPNVTAPGVSIASAGMGQGTEAAILSGTSMAAPHTAGMAALVKQAHPSWKKVKYWAAAIENTADPGGVSNYSTRGGGTGFIQAVPATKTDVVALGTKDAGALSFGFAELKKDFSEQQTITLKNFGDSPATFNVSDALPQGSPHVTTFSSNVVTVPARGERDVRVRLTVPAGTAGGAVIPCAGVTCSATPFSQVAGLVAFTPTSSSNNGVTLRVPFSLAPQEISQVNVKRLSRTVAQVTNKGPATGSHDWYAWGIKDTKDHGLGSNDIQAVGAQSFPADELLVFSIATRHRWSNATQNEFDISVDVNNDGTNDYLVVVADFGALTTGDFDGVDAVAVFNLNRPAEGGTINWLADAPTDSSTMTVNVDFSQLTDTHPETSLGGANQRFTYGITSFGLTDDTSDAGDMTAKFNPFNSAVNTGMGNGALAPGSTDAVVLQVNSAEQALSPALGWLVISHENAEKDEASFIDVR